MATSTEAEGEGGCMIARFAPSKGQACPESALGMSLIADIKLQIAHSMYSWQVL